MENSNPKRRGVMEWCFNKCAGVGGGMAFFDINLDAISESHLLEIVATGVQEGVLVEYKPKGMPATTRPSVSS